MFNNINRNFNLGVDINPGTAISPAEYKLALSTALFNGRVTVTTDVGTQSGIPTATPSASTNNNFVGEATVGYSLSKNGNLKLKAFNKANDNTTLEALNAPYTQGVGLSYKESFNTWGEFFHKLFGKKSKTAKTTDSDSE
jgi:hypothetical protein